MCQESLIAYLQTGIEDEETKNGIANFVKTNDVEELGGASSDLAMSIDQKLKDVKICDPAIGSGAFPMGLLRELYACRKAIEVFESDNAADIKRHIIQNNIYGVDIEKGAVDIARLRFWLALIIDEKDPMPLPNLDFKIMQGNSLLESYMGVDLNMTSKKVKTGRDTKKTRGVLSLGFEETDVQKTIQDLVKSYFSITDHTLRAQRRKEIDKYVKDYIKICAEGNKEVQNAVDKLEIPNNQFFLWHTYFNDVFEKGGFDIVIGNPPYVFARNSDEKGMSEKDKAYYYLHFELAKYQINLYHLFIEQGTNLLSEGGVFSFIIPNNWLTINTNVGLRKYVLSKSNIQITNFYTKVFESADVDSSILIYINSSKNPAVTLAEASTKETFEKIKTLPSAILLKEKDYVINIERYKKDEFTDIIQKIEACTKSLGGNFADVKAGLQAYEVGKGTPLLTKEMKKDRIYHSKVKIDSSYFKYIDGVDVRRYAFTWYSGEYLKYGKNLAAPRKWNLFSTPRILVRQIPSKPPYCILACYTDETFLNDRNSMNIVNIRCNPFYLLAVLNSRAISFWFEHKFGKLQRGLFPQFKINELASFPIPVVASKQQVNLEKFVEEILRDKNENVDADTTALENQIDFLVYHLYGLTYDEVLIVDPNPPFTREEYEAYKGE